MVQNIVLACLFFLTVSAFPDDRSCPGGYREGEQVELSTFWYECRNSQLVPRGCLAPDNRRVELGSYYDVKSVRWQCAVDSSGFPARVQHSCLSNNREYRESEKWDDGRVVYQCQRDRDYFNIVPAGCLSTRSQRMDLGQKATDGDLVYECRLNRDSVPTYTPWGCADKQGRQYGTGDQFEDGEFLYYCMKKDDGRIVAEKIGCVRNNQRMKHGDKFTENDVIYFCSVSETNAELEVAGCLTHSVVSGPVERKVGCTWVEGNEPFQITYQCKPDPARRTAIKTAVRCNYAFPNGIGTYNIELGCYRVVDKTRGAACIKGSGDADVQFVSLSVDNNGNVISPPAGTRYC